MRKSYMLKKESVGTKVGAIFREQENGEFELIDDSFKKFSETTIHLTRRSVVEQPEWFEEVKPFWLKVGEFLQVDNFINRKRGWRA